MIARCVALAVLVLACSGERRAVRIALEASVDQAADFDTVTEIELTLSSAGLATEKRRAPFPASAAFLSLSFPLRARVDARFEAFDANGASLFFGERLGIDAPGDVALRVLRRNDFARAPGAMRSARSKHTATRLQDGRVLIVGGEDPTSGQSLASSELYEPATATFSAGPSLTHARADHAAVLLSDGRVLVAGGASTATTFVVDVEAYDPRAGSFAVVDRLSTERTRATATVFRADDGERVLIAGGRGMTEARSSADIFIVATNRFALPRTMVSARAGHAAAPIAGGILLVGGHVSELRGEVFRAAENRFVATTGAMEAPRPEASSAVLADGRVVVGGGSARLEVFDAAATSFARFADLPAARTRAPMVALAGDAVLVAGGVTGASTADAFVVDAARVAPTTRPLDVARDRHTLTALADGTALVVGGTADPALARTAELYLPW